MNLNLLISLYICTYTYTYTDTYIYLLTLRDSHDERHKTWFIRALPLHRFPESWKLNPGAPIYWSPAPIYCNILEPPYLPGWRWPNLFIFLPHAASRCCWSGVQWGESHNLNLLQISTYKLQLFCPYWMMDFHVHIIQNGEVFRQNPCKFQHTK